LGSLFWFESSWFKWCWFGQGQWWFV